MQGDVNGDTVADFGIKVSLGTMVKSLLWHLADVQPSRAVPHSRASVLRFERTEGSGDEKNQQAYGDQSRAGLPFLAARTISRCLGCRTEKRVEATRLGNTVAMTHYRRIVNARGHQQWHGHDRYDKGHPTLPYVA